MSKIGTTIRRAPLRDRCVYLKPWDGFKSIAHVLSTVRTLEKRFGPAERIQIPREMLYSPNYRMYGWVTFERPIDQKDWGDAQFRLMEVPAPTVDMKKPGGLGLSDISSFTKPNDKASAPEWSSLTDKMSRNGSGPHTSDIRLERSTGVRKDIRIPNAPLYRSKIIGFSQAFTSFNGFAETPTAEMIRVKNHWEAKAKSYRINLRTPPIPSSDPLAEYLDMTAEQDPILHTTLATESASTPPPPANDISDGDGPPPVVQVDPTQAPKAIHTKHKRDPKVLLAKQKVDQAGSASQPKPSRRSATLQLARERGAALERKRLAEMGDPKRKWNEGTTATTEPDSTVDTKDGGPGSGEDPTVTKKLLGWLRS